MTDNIRVALVTGANKGIGLEIARQLAQAGVRVLIGARDDGRARAAVDDLASQGLVAHSVRVDLDDEDSITNAAATIAQEHGQLDILVNNAGIFDTADGPPGTASLAAVRRVRKGHGFRFAMRSAATSPANGSNPRGRLPGDVANLITVPLSRNCCRLCENPV